MHHHITEYLKTCFNIFNNHLKIDTVSNSQYGNHIAYPMAASLQGCNNMINKEIQ